MKVFAAAVLTLIVSFAMLGVSPQALAATDILTGNGNGLDCSGDNANTAVCQQHDNSRNPLTGCTPAANPSDPPTGCGTGVLYDVTNIVSYIGGAAAVIVIIVGALRFATSGSDVSTNSRTDTDIETARRTIGGALIGLVIIILGRFLIDFVLSKL